MRSYYGRDNSSDARVVAENYHLMVAMKRLLDQKFSQQQELRASIIIQSYYRGWLVRRSLLELNGTVLALVMNATRLELHTCLLARSLARLQIVPEDCGSLPSTEPLHRSSIARNNTTTSSKILLLYVFCSVSLAGWLVGWWRCRYHCAQANERLRSSTLWCRSC